MDTTKVPGHTRLYPKRLEVDSLGRPWLVAGSAGGVGYDTHVLSWGDNGWVVRADLGYGVNYSWPVVTTGDPGHLVWQTADAIYEPGLPYLKAYFVMSRFDGTGFVTPDTIAMVASHDLSYTAASSPRRRWAAKHDYTNLVRLWYSDTVGIWREVEVPGFGNDGVAVAPLGDTTAIMVWASWNEPLSWGIVDGTTWADGGTIPGPVPLGFAVAPKFSRRTDGTLHLAWSTDHDYVQVASYRGGAWSDAESLTCAKPVPGEYVSRANGISRNGAYGASVAWVEHDVFRGFLGTICVCVPTDSGYPAGEHVPGTDGAWNLDTVRDGLGETWVVWQTETNGLFWTHSYVRAAAEPPVVSGSTATRTVRWTLSEPAPGSWWVVQRAPPGGAFEEVARVRAGDGIDLEWRDDAPAPDTLRYRVRRESVDRRYEWLSDETVWTFDPTPALVSLLHAEAEPDRVRLVWAGAGAGALAAAVERRSEAEDWRALGAALPDGPDRLAYVDTTVLPGARFAYRLAWTEDGVEHRSPEAWVEVPRALELALEGLRPNPSAGRPQVAFTLPAAGRARIELLDVAGRRVLRHDAGVLPAGRHVVDLAGAARLAPGVYLVRLESGGRTVKVRGVVVR